MVYRRTQTRNRTVYRPRQPILRYRQRGQSVGDHMEETVAFFAKKSNPDAQWLHGGREDIAEGTDIIVEELRMDVTTDFFEKDNIGLPIDTGIIAFDYTPYYLCVRTGNNYKGGTDFDYPVIVLGIPCSSQNYTRRVQDLLSETLEEHIDTLLLMADDLRMFYETKDPEYNPTKLPYQEQRSRVTYRPTEITTHSRNKLRFNQLSQTLPESVLSKDSHHNNLTLGG